MGRRRLQAILLLFVLFFVASLLPAKSASGQAADNGALNLTTTPLPLNLIAKPGETSTVDLRVKNSGTRSEQLQVTLFKFSAYGEEGQPRLEERGENDDYFDWVSFSEKTFTAEPNVWKNVKMTIKIPRTAGLGYYYAVVFSRAGTDFANPDQTSLQGGTASLVLLDVRVPGAKRELSIVEFSSSKKVYEFLPAEFAIKLRNTGNIHLSPAGTLFITKGNEEIAKVNLNESRGNILPESNRNFSLKWADGFPVYKDNEVNGKVEMKDNKPVRKLNWNFADFSKFRMGKFTANLLLVYDDGQRDVPVEASVDFWVIPWRILGVSLLIVLFVGVGLYTMGRKLFKGARKLTGRKKKDHGQQ